MKNGFYESFSKHKGDIGLQGLLEDIPCGAVIYKVEGDHFVEKSSNEEYRKMFSFLDMDVKDFCLSDLEDYLDEKSLSRLRSGIEKVIEHNDTYKGELKFMTSNGMNAWMEFKSKKVSLSEEEDNLYCIFNDITEQRSAFMEMSRKVVTDQLTGLLNKTATIESINRCIDNSTPITKHVLLVIDVDDFKSINDCYGHLFGDTVIQSIADKLRNIFRGTDIVGRFGGDEFVVFMKNVEIERAMTKAHEICSIIHRVYGDDRGKVRVSCSVGMAVYPDDGTEFTSLFEDADAALYTVKSSGKGKVMRYNDHMSDFLFEHEEAEVSAYDEPDFDTEDYDREFVSFALKLLSSTDNVRSSIDILLERVGQKFDLGAVALFEKTRAGATLRATNYWIKNMSASMDNNILEDVEMGIEDNADENGVTIIQDCTSQSFSINFRPAIEKLRVKTMLAFDFRGNALVPGKLLVCDCAKTREWTAYEMKTYYELSRILAVFATLRMERALRMNSLAINPPEKGSYKEYEEKLKGRRVLVVEDNRINSEIAKTVVEYGGMIAEIVENGREALEQILSKDSGYYDAILMDIEMPVMDGYEATKRIRNCGRRDCREIPILAMTHLSADKDVLKEFEAGMSAHVSKPIDIDVLYSVMGKALT